MADEIPEVPSVPTPPQPVRGLSEWLRHPYLPHMQALVGLLAGTLTIGGFVYSYLWATTPIPPTRDCGEEDLRSVAPAQPYTASPIACTPPGLSSEERSPGSLPR